MYTAAPLRARLTASAILAGPSALWVPEAADAPAFPAVRAGGAVPSSLMALSILPQTASSSSRKTAPVFRVTSRMVS